jgi:hypothetical protein
VKPEFIPLKDPAVVTLNGRRLAIVGGSRRREPFEIRWWAFSALGDVVVIERQWFSFVDSTSNEIHRPCHIFILPQVKNFVFKAGFAMGEHIRQPLLEMNAHKSLFAF